MIELDSSHPSFSLQLEMLASLPCEPSFVPLKTLASDFSFVSEGPGHRAIDQVSRLLGDLQVKGIDGRGKDTYSIRVFRRRRHGYVANIRRTDWARASRAGVAYLALVYGSSGRTVAPKGSRAVSADP